MKRFIAATLLVVTMLAPAFAQHPEVTVTPGMNVSPGPNPQGVGTSTIKGTAVFFFNNNLGNKPDVGARVFIIAGIIPDVWNDQAGFDKAKVHAYRTSLADGAGNFSFPGIPSGTYTVLVQSANTRGGEGPELMGKIRQQTVTLRPGETQDVSINFGIDREPSAPAEHAIPALQQGPVDAAKAVFQAWHDHDGVTLWQGLTRRSQDALVRWVAQVSRASLYQARRALEQGLLGKVRLDNSPGQLAEGHFYTKQALKEDTDHIGVFVDHVPGVAEPKLILMFKEDGVWKVGWIESTRPALLTD